MPTFAKDSQQVEELTRQASEAISRWEAVVYSGTDMQVRRCQNTDEISAVIGVATEDAAEGQLVRICYHGVYKVKADGLVEAGSSCKPEDDGTVTKLGSNASPIFALESASGSLALCKISC